MQAYFKGKAHVNLQSNIFNPKSFWGGGGGGEGWIYDCGK